ncbi:unnamed protein product [Hymenolepis diminuta]|uniref:Uncharacterized protein n=1 Tax=Hymenolepis diminuta TaxID=6216 RepID=A0A564Z4R3_HYMDI|nr:unnamed protein product [Hymenolepis diminuta]VUZ54291.1 unnamed protein product [Hymenolepis diminuta]VUZ55598.1 unnamed protein product [Hymenolepis diminuta]
MTCECSYRISPFYNGLVSLKSTSALLLSCGITQMTPIELYFFHSKHNACASVTGSYVSLSSPLHLSLFPYFSFLFASILIVASLNKFWSDQVLVFCSTIVVSSYSNTYELVTVVAVVCC